MKKHYATAIKKVIQMRTEQKRKNFFFIMEMQPFDESAEEKEPRKIFGLN